MPSLLLLVLLLPCPAVAADWRTASRESAGIAPKPEAHPDAVVHVYGAAREMDSSSASSP